jgi:hypothetical protein
MKKGKYKWLGNCDIAFNGITYKPGDIIEMSGMETIRWSDFEFVENEKRKKE